MKRLLLLALAVGFAACSPDIPNNPSQANKFVTAEFDPAHSVIPLPNDLVFIDANGVPQKTLQAPTTGGTDAQNEFNRDYLNGLDGFPMETAGSTLFDKPIDPATVVLFPAQGATLAVFDVQHGVPVTNLNVTVADAANGAQTLNFLPKSGFWNRGGQYAVLVLGGANGIKGKQSGQTVTGSPTWALVNSSSPLVTCDANGNNCTLGTTAIPTPGITDPAAQYDEQVRLAKQLEQLRLGYKPIIDGALAQIPGLNRTDIVLVWTFTITSHPEVTFDPANLVIPFPNDILNPTGSKVTIPPGTGLPAALVAGLNTLDGFSTTAPIVSENGDGTGPLIQGKVDVASVSFGTTGTINLVAAGAGKGAQPTVPGGAVKAHACLNCPPIVMLLPDAGPILLPDGGAKPDTLAIVPDVPLTERTQYAAYITTDLQAVGNVNVIASPAFALVRSSAPLYDGTHTTVSLLTDAQAQQLEQLRAGLKPLFDTLSASGLPRKKVALAWAFTTQSTVTTLSQLHAAPDTASFPIPPFPAWVQEIPPPAGVPATGVGHWYIGQIFDVFALTGQSGTLNPDPTKWTAPKIAFVMSVPAAAAPAGGYPVTIFGHGLGGNRTNGFGMSASLAAAGNVMLAIDEPWHGDRNTCTGFGAFVTAAGVPNGQDAFACANPAAQTCNTAGHCQATDRTGALACAPSGPGMADQDKVCMLNGQGHCATDGKCENGSFAANFTPAPGVNIPVNGWNLINLLNFFATRDNFRQQVLSHAQVARVTRVVGNGSLAQQAGDIAIDSTKLSYAGQSLGGILGSLYSGVSSEVKNSALNVPGGGLTSIILTSPAFVQLKTAFQAGLAAEGVPVNSPTYDTFLGIVQWIIDPADPLNAGPYLVRDTGITGLPNGGGTRRGFIQWVLNDQVVPNPTTVDLIQAVMADPNASGVLVTPTAAVPRFWAKQWQSTANHGFLLVGPDAAAAQAEIANFISGAAPF